MQIFSGISGIILILFKNKFAKLFELTTATPFWIIGVALIFFSLTISYEVKKQNRLRIIWIIIQDTLWFFSSIYLLIFNTFHVSTSGNYAIGIVAIIVLLMAVNQAKALRKLSNIGK